MSPCHSRPSLRRAPLPASITLALLPALAGAQEAPAS